MMVFFCNHNVPKFKRSFVTSQGGDMNRAVRWTEIVGALLVVTTLHFMQPVTSWSAAAKPKAGGTLTVAVEEDCKGFDPIKAGYLSPQARSVAMAIEERLFDTDGKGNLVPELGLSATPSKDGKSWTITLRKGVLFHDGTPFNADAVVAHWSRILAPDNKFRGASLLQPIATVLKLDNHTVRFQLKHPWLPFKDVLASTTAIAAYIPSPKAVKEGTQDRAPVGTGPYRFKEWLASDHLTVVKNSGYWRKGSPHLDTIIFKTVPDMQTRYAGLKSGELDVILTDRGASIIQAKSDPALKVYSINAAGAETFLLNTSKPPLNDVRVRKALAHAWNQEFYIKASFKDTIPEIHDPFGGSLSCGTLNYPEYNPEKARKLLAEYGKPVSLDLQVTSTPRGREFGDMVQRMFKEVGVAVTVTPLALGQRTKQVFAGDYQMTGWQVFDATDMGPTLYTNLFSQSALNFSKYQNPEMDRLLSLSQTATKPKDRTRTLCGVAKIINDDAVFLYRGGIRYNAIAKTDVKGIERVDHGVIRVRDLWWGR